MSEFGDVRYSREVRGTVWTQFREGGAAQTAINARIINAGALDWEVSPVKLQAVDIFAHTGTYSCHA
jgi:hypothetical protein